MSSPTVSPKSPQRFTTQRLVEFRDTDAAGMMHFTAFFGYMESVEHEFLRSLGLSVIWQDEQGKVSWPRVSAQCDFRGAAGFEDSLDIELTIRRLGSKSVTYSHTIRCRGEGIAQGEVTAVCCRLTPEGLRSIPIPPEWLERLRPFEVAEDDTSAADA